MRLNVRSVSYIHSIVVIADFKKYSYHNFVCSPDCDIGYFGVLRRDTHEYGCDKISYRSQLFNKIN